MLGRRRSTAPQQLLTDREWTVLQLVAEGLSNQEIAERLTLSLTTIKWYIKQIFNKLGANRRTQAVSMARELGLIDTAATVVEVSPGLPVPSSALIGREQEVSQILDLLDDPEIRLVTILGPGGMGKTHLALEIARQLARRGPGQVCFVALDSVGALSGVIPAVAEAIGYQFFGEADPGQQLLASLQGRQMLLVMDSFEQRLESGKLVAEMLAGAPRLKILCTSRERINLRAETVFRLHGLAYPLSPDQAQTYAAFQLFVRAARRSQPELQLTDDDVIHISRICQLAEGMPLGLELAATWMDALTPAQIANEIAGNLSILQAAIQDAPERHRSIYAVFEHSWRLLADNERAVFERLSVFCGGFDRTAAEAVAGATLFTLSTLIDKSLVIRVGPDRFKLHELLRQFAEDKLRTDEQEYRRILHRHCHHYASRAQDYETRIKTDVSSLFGSLMDIQKDFDNFMAGWNRALEVPFVAEIGMYAYCIGILLAFRGLHVIGEQTFAQASRLYESQRVPVDPSDRVRVMSHLGRFLSDRVQYGQAYQVLERALELASTSNSTRATDTGLLLGFLGWAQYLNNQPDQGRERLRQGLDLCQAAGDHYGVWIGHGLLGEIAYGEGQYALAYQHHYQGLTDCERFQHLSGMPYTLMLLGFASCALGDTGSANDYLRRGLNANRKFLFVVPFLLAVIGIAALNEQRNQPQAALELVALALHHRHWGGALPELKARVLLARLQSRIPTEHIQSVMAKAKLGQLSHRHLDPQFNIKSELVDTLFRLLEEVAAP